MCGVFGIYSYNTGLLDAGRNNPALDLLRHRGPDDSGVYQDEYIFIGHTRLSILDIETGQQPMTSDDGRYTIAYNGEIYNYLELRNEISKLDVSFATRSDTEVILKYFQCFGPVETLNRIEGMFAFGIWDRLKSELFLARDRIGEKPMYYAYNANTFVFSSEIKSILSSGIVSDNLNENGLFEYFCRTKIAGSRTFIKDVRELKPGHYMLINDLGVRPCQRKYWDLVTEYMIGRDSKIVNEIEAYQAIETSMLQSFESRMISDVPVGLLTSGGIDSSVVAGVLAGKGYQDLKCFCAGNNNSAIDESPFAQQLVSYINRKTDANFDLVVVKKDLVTLIDIVENLTYIYDEPLQFNNSIAMYYLCVEAKKYGIKVLLSGEGADELFCGYDRYERTFEMADEQIANGNRIEDILYYGGGLDNTKLVADMCGLTHVNADTRLLGESYEWLKANNNIPMMGLILLYDQHYRLQFLNQRQDRMGMAAGIELRQPFLNYQLVNLANSLDINLKFNKNSGQRKYILKRIAEKYIPDDIIARPKRGFPSDLGVWLRSAEGYSTLSDLVEDSNSIARNYLQYNVVQDVLQSHFTNTKSYDFLIMCLFHLEVWNKSIIGRF